MSTNADEVKAYYNKTESRMGYDILLHGTKHFGYYEPGQRMWDFGSAMLQMTDRLGQVLGLYADALLLDAGCGVGDVARRLATVNGCDVIGIDILNFNIAEARKRASEFSGRGKLHFEEMDYSELGFDNCAFDGAYTMETLVHALDPERVLSEFYRVLKPGSPLVLFEYSHLPYSEMPARARDAFIKINAAAAMPAFDRFEHGCLPQLLIEQGFEDVKIEDITYRMWPMLHAFSLLGWIPYSVAGILNLEGKIPNAMSGVELWKYRDLWSYNIVSARKPV